LSSEKVQGKDGKAAQSQQKAVESKGSEKQHVNHEFLNFHANLLGDAMAANNKHNVSTAGEKVKSSKAEEKKDAESTNANKTIKKAHKHHKGGKGLKADAKVKDSKAEEKSDTMTDEAKPEEDSMAEDPDAIPSMQLAWEMIELARVIYKQREESMERDIKISECYLRLGEIGLENENYTGAIGDLLECQVLQKQHFEKLDRRIAETHYHLGSAYSFEKRYNNAKEHFEAARKVIIDKIDKLTEEFDAESETQSSDEKLMSEKTNEIAQLKDILPDLNSKLEDIESSIKNEKFNKVQEHLDEKKGDVSTAEVSDIQHLVKRKQEEKEKMDSAEKKLKMET
jgi:tetratricopeptide (TPR) repeat protein